ncbi:hypothetical protein [Methylophaga thiooxydans]|uniref:hypothetical protein n=1 Tax=Methylophaga thiooxydans TaxID=392484 RepID=UPI0023554CCB|nr:hypothetical protein [Methylophaga thiooxydans]
MKLFNGDNLLTFIKFIEVQRSLIEQQEGFVFALLRKDFYLKPLKQYWQVFDIEQLLKFGIKYMVFDIRKMLDHFCEFLNIRSNDRSMNDRELCNVQDFTETMIEAHKYWLEIFFLELNYELAEHW